MANEFLKYRYKLLDIDVSDVLQSAAVIVPLMLGLFLLWSLGVPTSLWHDPSSLWEFNHFLVWQHTLLWACIPPNWTCNQSSRSLGSYTMKFTFFFFQLSVFNLYIVNCCYYVAGNSFNPQVTNSYLSYLRRKLFSEDIITFILTINSNNSNNYYKRANHYKVSVP